MSVACITYDERDSQHAARLAELLRGQGINVLLPDRSVEAATVSATFHQAIDQCSLLLVLLSRHSTDSEEVARDIRRTMARSKIIAVVRIEEVPLSDRLTTLIGHPSPLDWNASDLSSNDFVSGAVKSLLERLSTISAPEPVRQPAGATNATAGFPPEEQSPPPIPQVRPASKASTPAATLEIPSTADPALAGPEETPVVAAADFMSPEPPGTVVSRFVDGLNELRDTASVDAAPRPGIVGKIDRFEIVRVLGQGGMGVVLLARDPDNNAMVAVKTIAPKFVGNERANNRFTKEAHNMKRMSHPNILKVTEVVNRPNGAYYVMPFINAGSLARMLDANKSIDENALVRISMQVADALRYAHDEAGVIHRDIKPENILVDDSGNAYVSDFGLVRSLLVNETVPEYDRGWTVGTARYMAPEIADGRAGDTRADIYSFGAMLYELATGRAPYEDVGPGEQNFRIIDRIKASPPTPAAKLNAHISPNLLRVIEGTMARELRDRYAHMKDVLEDLKRITLGVGVRGPHDQPAPAPQPKPVPIPQQPYPPQSVMTSQAPSHGVMPWVAAIGLLILVVGCGGAIYAYVSKDAAATQNTTQPIDPPVKRDQPTGKDDAKEPQTITVDTATSKAIALIEQGNQKEAIAWLDQAKTLNQQEMTTQIGQPLLQKAAKHNRLDVIKYLIDNRKFDINFVDPGTNETALDVVDPKVEPGPTTYGALRAMGAKHRSELP